MANPGNSLLSSLFRSMSNTPSTSSGSTGFGNTSWGAGSSTSNKAPSYVTIMKAPKQTSGTAGKAVASHFGLNIKDPKNTKAKPGHHSILGSILSGGENFVGNLTSDVINTAEGTPAGLLKLATTNPIDTAKAIGHDYATRYGKLFKGDFGGFAHDIESHPFSYLLDASTLGTGSGAVLGRLVPELAKGGEVALRVDRAASKAGEVVDTTKQLSRNPFTRNVFEKPAYALQRTLPNVPIVGERSAAIRHITNQVEGTIGQLGHAKQVFEKAVRDVRHQSLKDDTLTQAFDSVNADIRHRPLQVFGQGLHTPVSRAFNPKRDTLISENATRHSAEITSLADQIKSEITLDSNGALVAKEGASPATQSFLKVHNAQQTLNQSLLKTESIVPKISAKAVANTVAKSTRKTFTPRGATNLAKAHRASAIANRVAPKTASFLDGVRAVDTHTDPISNYLEMQGKAVKAAGNAVSKGFLEKYGENPKLANEITGIFDKHSPAGSLSGNFNKATQIWKDMILVGRPAFLVNNFVGNQTMFHLKNGIGGISLQKAAKGELDPAFDNHFFEHRQSLGSSEQAAPKYDNYGNELAPGRYRRSANRVYNVQSAHEQVLRKATMREVALSIPAVKTEVRRLIGEKNLSEGKALNQAMTKAFKENPGYREIIAKGIDDTMGNYRHYNNFEKGLKQIVPFYGWNRHALRTYTSMIKDQPGRTSVIGDISRQGQADNAKNFPGAPSFMSTYVTGKLGTFDTQALNPLKGGSDTIKSIKELIHGKSGQLPTVASNLNPFLSGAAQGLSGVNLTTGAPIKTSGGLLGSVFEQTTQGLPQVKLAELAAQKYGLTSTGGNRKDPHYFLTPTGQLKKKFLDSSGQVKLGPDGLPLESNDRHMIVPSLENSVFAYLGVPRRTVNLKTAQTVEKSILTKTNPNPEFHARKTKAAIAHIVKSSTKKPKALSFSKTGFGG